MRTLLHAGPVDDLLEATRQQRGQDQDRQEELGGDEERAERRNPGEEDAPIRTGAIAGGRRWSGGVR